MMFPRIARRALLLFILATATSGEVRAQSTLIPLTARQAMVFDHSSQHLYITTSTGVVQRYNLTTKTIDQTYTLGGTLNGIDIAPDDSFLLVTKEEPSGNDGIVYKVNLADGTIMEIMVPLDTFLGEHGMGGDVAIASNGLAIVGPGAFSFIRLRQIDLATNALTVRKDNGGQDGWQTPPVQIYRSGDHSLLYLMQGGSGTPIGTVSTYNATTNSFSPGHDTRTPLVGASGAVNHNGSLIVTRTLTGQQTIAEARHAALDRASDFTFLHDFNKIDGNVVFGGTTGILYGVSGANNQIIGYDSLTFAEKFRLNLDEPPSIQRVGAGNFVSTPDGKYLALVSASGVRIYSTAAGFLAPAPTPTLSTRRDLVFDHSGRFAYISTSDGFVERYDLTNGNLQIVGDLGGSLYGIDIAPDDSFVVVAQLNMGIAQGAFQKLDLGTGVVSSINYPRPQFYFSTTGSTGSFYGNVVVASNQLAFGNTAGNPSLHRLDLTTSSSSVLAGGPRGDGFALGRSTDHSRVLLSEAHVYNYGTDQVWIYHPAANTLTPSTQPATLAIYGVNSVNRSATLIARHHNFWTTLNTVPDIHFIHPFTGTDSGIAFDGSSDIFYAVNSVLDQVIAYDTNSFQEKFRIPVGENVTNGAFNIFDTGTLRASPDGKHLALFTHSGIRFLNVPTGPFPPPPTPTMDDPRDLVFDHSGNYLYIGDDNGWVHRYNLATDQLDAHYNVGGQPNGIDIAPDDSFLLVAQGVGGLAEASFQKVDLPSGNVTNNTFPFTAPYGYEWAFDVAIGPNGHAIGVSRYQPWQLDPFTHSVSLRTDTYPSVEWSGVSRNANASLFVVGGSTGARTYTPATDTFGPLFNSSFYPSVNRDGTLVMGDGYLQSLTTFAMLHHFDNAGPRNPFDATRDLVYTVNPIEEKIIAYDTNTFAERFRLNIGERTSVEPNFFEYQFGSGNLVASHDGRNIALITPTAVRVYDVSNPPRFPPATTPTITGARTFKTSGTVSIYCFTPNSTIYYTLDGSNPTTASPIFPAPVGKKKKVKKIRISNTTTVKAIALAPNYDQSATATAVFTKVTPRRPR